MGYEAVREARKEADGEFKALDESLARKRQRQALGSALPNDWPTLQAANDNDLRYDCPRVIGLQGYGGSGKSEVRKVLEQRGYVAQHIKAPIAEMVDRLLYAAGVEEAWRYIDGDLKRIPVPGFNGRTGTELQQFVGTELGRNFIDPDIWLHIWCRWADEQLTARRPVVQESVRFANEASAIRDRGGVIFEVRRPGVGPVNAHVSEALPVNADYVIHNTGSLADLESRVITAMEMV